MAECLHETLFFGSGDYYIFCRDCQFCWRIEDGHEDNQGQRSQAERCGKPWGTTPESGCGWKGMEFWTLGNSGATAIEYGLVTALVAILAVLALHWLA